MRYIKLIACRVMLREVSLISATSDTIVDVTWLEWGLHDKIGELAVSLQREIDSIDSGSDPHTTYPPPGKDFEAIILGYGLCSNGTVGLSSKRYPIVIPRAHDCITLFLGSKEKYSEVFSANPGTFWYSAGWAESANELSSEELRQSQYLQFVDQYGEETAAEMAEMFGQMLGNYSQLGLIRWPEFAELGFMREAESHASQYAAENGWNFEGFDGDSSLLRDLLGGNWDDERFITIPPGAKPAPSYDDAIFKCME